MLKCDNTTEQVEDEPYYIIGTKHSKGAVSSYRVPGPSGHWSMNDNGNNQRIENISLAEFNLEEGEYLDILVNLMEEDGGMANDYLNAFATFLSQIDTPYTLGAAVLIGGISKLFKIQDTDDWLGSFAIRVSKKKGGNSIEFKIINEILPESNLGQVIYRGAGCDYTGAYGIQG